MDLKQPIPYYKAVFIKYFIALLLSIIIVFFWVFFRKNEFSFSFFYGVPIWFLPVMIFGSYWLISITLFISSYFFRENKEDEQIKILQSQKSYTQKKILIALNIFTIAILLVEIFYFFILQSDSYIIWFMFFYYIPYILLCFAVDLLIKTEENRTLLIFSIILSIITSMWQADFFSLLKV